MKTCQAFDAAGPPIEGNFTGLKEGIYRTDIIGWKCFPPGSKAWLNADEVESRILSRLLRETGARRPCVVLVVKA